MNKFSYILLTSAKNEETYLEKSIQSVIQQNILPEKWIIINDCSTDRTEQIVEHFATQYDFIELVRGGKIKKGVSPQRQLGLIKGMNGLGTSIIIMLGFWMQMYPLHRDTMKVL